MSENNHEDPALDGLKQSYMEILKYYDAHLDTVKILRDLSKLFFTSASVLVPIIISFNVFLVNVLAQYQKLYNVLLVSLVILFSGFLCFSIWNLIPPPLSRPLSRNYEELVSLLCVGEKKRYKVLVDQYSKSMEVNAPIINWILIRLIITGVLFGLIVAVIIGLAMIPKA